MSGKVIAVTPERCSGCMLCELVCAMEHHKVMNPKKSAVRVMVVYPHPVIRMPIICSQCRDPKCAVSCPVNAITRDEGGVVRIDREECVGCQHCVEACPFGAIYVHDDISTPFMCDLCGGEPKCVEICPKQAIKFIPEHLLGQEHRVSNILNYTHMKEVEFIEKGEEKKLRYTATGKDDHEI